MRSCNGWDVRYTAVTPLVWNPGSVPILVARATCEGACDGGGQGGEACGDDAEARDVAEASRDERDLTLQEVVSAVDGAVEAASAAAFAARATAEAGGSAQGEGQSGAPRRQGRGGGTRRLRLAKVAAEAREAAARLDEELEAGEYVTEFVDLSEEESSGEEGGAQGRGAKRRESTRAAGGGASVSGGAGGRATNGRCGSGSTGSCSVCAALEPRGVCMCAQLWFLSLSHDSNL